jgi:GTP-binding protein HflX
VGLITPLQSREKAKEYLDELAFLAKTAGAIPEKIFLQQLDHPNPETFVGPGKLEQIKNYLMDHPVDMAVFDDELSARQIRNLESELKIKILDRTNLILDIFAKRAKTASAKLRLN